MSFKHYLTEVEKRFNIKKEFKKFNDDLFDGKLPTIKMRTAKKSQNGYAGWLKTYYWTNKNGDVLRYAHKELMVTSEYDNESTQGLLIHEMIHLWLNENGLYEDYNVKYHGKEFMAKLKELQQKTAITIPSDEGNLEWFEKTKKRAVPENTKEYGVIVMWYKSYDAYMIYVADVDVIKNKEPYIIELMEQKINMNTNVDIEIYVGTSSHKDLSKYKKNRAISDKKFSTEIEKVSKEIVDDMNKKVTINTSGATHH